MIPAAFDYLRPGTLDEAVGLLAQHGEDAKVLAGGHSLIPAMKLRLAQPKTVIDISRIADLNYIREQDGKIAIGAMTTHYELESSSLLRDQCPLLPEVAAHIGDVQVRNKGTIGGSLVHADPAADWPAAILALEAELHLAGPNGSRMVKAANFFVEMMQSTVQPNEILFEIQVPLTPKSVAYVKFAQKASGFAIAGVAAVVDKTNKTVRVGVTGIAPKPYRAKSVESKLRGATLTTETIEKAARKAAQGVEPLNDIHASSAFRLHLAQLNTRRALALAASR
ncbi:MAG: xanthine dehydrogenase family protein subunit M [Verrucomicrobia bacterium]|nr:xanthine dehydrogenase family protein subunit M [Verrucomicrobiota bacterium]